MNEHSWRELVGEERPVGFDQVGIGVASSDTSVTTSGTTA